MKEILLSLIKLTEIDNKIDQILEDQKEIPNTVKDISEEILNLQKSQNELETQLTTLETQKKSVSDLISEKTQWAQEREARINEIKTSKEYQAASREISVAKKEIKDNEELLTKLDPQIAEAATALNQIKEQNQPKIDELKNKIQELKTKYDSIKSHLSSEQVLRTDALKNIPSEDAIRYYEKIHQRVSPALSKAENGICTECGTKILPQIFNQLASSPTIHFCNSCKRILYVDSMLND